MSDFKVAVTRVDGVDHHPNADRLSLITIKGYAAISAKLEDGSHRYKAGDYIAYIPEGSILPEWLLKRLDMWNHDLNKGGLSGPDGNRVKAVRLRGVISQGVMLPVLFEQSSLTMESGDGTYVFVSEGEDVSKLLGVTKYEPPIPTHLAGDVLNLFGHTMKYDFENWQGIPDIFDDGEIIVATEKLHGTNCQFGFVPGLNHPELFGEGDIYVVSKGLGAQGLAFKNNEANAGNLYVKVLRSLLSNGLREWMVSISAGYGGGPVHLWGEIFGKGVQDLHYGLDAPEFRAFDMAVGGTFLTYDGFKKATRGDGFNLPVVPVIYEGPFDAEVLKTHRDGKTTFGGANIREGIVIRACDGGRHAIHGRKIAKMVSPDYLFRKAPKGSEATEFN